MKKSLIFIFVILLIFSQSPVLADKVYEMNGCIYIVGDITTEQKVFDDTRYQARMNKLEIQRNIEIRNNHELQIEKIKAQALENYLNAQALVYGNFTKPKVNINNFNRSISNAEGGAGYGGKGGTSTTTNINTNDNRNTITVK